MNARLAVFFTLLISLCSCMAAPQRAPVPPTPDCVSPLVEAGPVARLGSFTLIMPAAVHGDPRRHARIYEAAREHISAYQRWFGQSKSAVIVVTDKRRFPVKTLAWRPSFPNEFEFPLWTFKPVVIQAVGVYCHEHDRIGVIAGYGDEEDTLPSLSHELYHLNEAPMDYGHAQSGWFVIELLEDYVASRLREKRGQ